MTTAPDCKVLNRSDGDADGEFFHWNEITSLKREEPKIFADLGFFRTNFNNGFGWRLKDANQLNPYILDLDQVVAVVDIKPGD